MSKKYVYLFSEGDAGMRNLLGVKGANLAEMTKLGLPVPQGFTISVMSSNGASARAFIVGYFAKSIGVIIFTLASVHCAARRTLTSSCHAFEVSRVHWAIGYACSSSRVISAACFFVFISVYHLFIVFVTYNITQIRIFKGGKYGLYQFNYLLKCFKAGGSA